jgi:hypothetical protein
MRSRWAKYVGSSLDARMREIVKVGFSASAALAARGDQIAPERPQPRQRTFLVAAREAAEADHVSGKYGCEFSGLCHGTPHHKRE